MRLALGGVENERTRCFMHALRYQVKTRADDEHEYMYKYELIRQTPDSFVDTTGSFGLFLYQRCFRGCRPNVSPAAQPTSRG